MRRIKKFRWLKGFTLLEVVFAMFVLGVLAIAIMGGYAQSIRSSGFTREATVATNLAQQALEGLKQYELQVPPPPKEMWDSYCATINNDTNNYNTNVDGINYTRTLIRKDVSGLSSNVVCVESSVTLPHWNYSVTLRSYYQR